MIMKVIIEREVYQKIMHWVDKAKDKEVSGLGRIVCIGDSYIVKSACMLKQKNTAADTELDATDISKAIFRTKDDEGMLNWWWHSHSSMGVFWSGTDMATIKELGANGFILATVFNNKREVKSAFHKKGDGVYPDMFIDNIDTQVRDNITKEIIASWDKEYDDNVVLPTYKQPEYKYGGDWHDHRFGGRVDMHDSYAQAGLMGYGTDEEYWKEIGSMSIKERKKSAKNFGPVRNPSSPSGYPLIEKDDLFTDELTNITIGAERYWWRRFFDEYNTYPLDSAMLEEFYLITKGGAK
jgi:hypothetical protein